MIWTPEKAGENLRGMDAPNQMRPAIFALRVPKAALKKAVAAP